MNTNIWRKIRRVLAFVLVVAMCSNSTPQVLMKVRAESIDISGEAYNVSIVNGVDVNGTKTFYLDTDVDENAEIKPTVKVAAVDDAENVLTENTDYTVAYFDNIAAGTGKVTVTGKAPTYTGTKTIEFKIEETAGDTSDNTGDDTQDSGAGNDNQSGDTDTSDDSTVTPGEGMETTDIELNSSNVTITFQKTYTDTKDVYAYNGKVCVPDVKVEYKNTAEGESAEAVDITNNCKVTYSNEGNANYVGKATVTVEPQEGSGYALVADTKLSSDFYVKYDLSKANVTLTDGVKFIYNGSEVKPDKNQLKVTCEEQVVDTSYYDIVISEGMDITNAGEVSAKIVATGTAGDYCMGEKEFTYTIAPKTTSAAIEAVTYCGSEFNLSDLIVKDSEGKKIENTNYTLSKTDNNVVLKNVNANGYELKIAATENGNYQFSEATVKLVVEPLNLATASDLRLEYVGDKTGTWNDKGITPDVKVIYKGVELPSSDYTVSALNETGEHKVTITGNETNLTGTKIFDETFTVNYDASITIDVLEWGDSLSSATDAEGATSYYYKDYQDIKINLASTEGESASYTIGNVTGKLTKAEDDSLTFSEELTSEDKVTIEIFKTNDGVTTKNVLELTNFVKDTSAPEVLKVTRNYTNPYSNEEGKVIWAQAIENITIDCTDAASGVGKVYYYYTDSEGKDSDKKELEKNTETNAWELTTVEPNATYYFWAEDNLGNEIAKDDYVSVTTPQIDKDRPYIEIKDGEKNVYQKNEEEGETKVYLNKDNASALKYTVTYSDENGSGYDEEAYPDTEITFTPEDADAAEIKDVEHTIKDNVTNSATHILHVIYDPISPVIGELEINGQKITEENNAVLTNADATIPVTVTEQSIGNEYQLKSVKLVKVTVNEAGEEQLETVEGISAGSATFDEVLAAVEDGKIKYNFSLTATEYLEKATYRVIACDNADNVMSSVDFTVEIDKIKPSVESVSINNINKNDDDWYHENAKFEIVVNNNHKGKASQGNAAVWLYYCKANVDTSAPAVPDENTIANWIKIEVSTYDAETDTYTFVVEEQDDKFNGNYYFWVTDSVNNRADKVVSQSFKADKIPANNIYDESIGAYKEAPIYVEYLVADEPDSKFEDLNNNANLFNAPSEYLLNSNTIKRLFAQKNIAVRLYVYDNFSGVDKISYTCGDVEGEATAFKDASATINDVSYSYAILSLSKAEAKNLKLTKITDCAGNVYTGSGEPVKLPEGNTVLIIDNVAPKLEVAGRTPDGADDDRNYYQPQVTGTEDGSKQTSTVETIALTFEEAFYKENVTEVNGKEEVIPPSIIIHVNGEEMDAEKLKQCVSLGEWGTNPDAPGTIVATISLPYSAEVGGEELEYEIFTTYADGSGNKLVAKSEDAIALGKFDGNTYQSGIIVLDNKAPELVSYSIQDPTGTYKKLKAYNKDNVSLEFKLTDNEAYWTHENVVLEVYKDGVVTEEIRHSTKIMVGDVEKTWEETWSYENGDYTIPYTISHASETASTYKVKLRYHDLAENKLIGSDAVTEGKVSDGVYTSEEFVIDTQAPKFTIEYNAANRLVDVVDSGDDVTGENAYPATGYTAYYQDAIEVNFTIEESYGQSGEDASSVLNGFTYAILEADANGDVLKNEDGSEKTVAVSDFVLKGPDKNNLYTGSFKIDKEGSYIIRMSYTDQSSNSMVAGETVQGKKTDTELSGQYTSVRLVLDKTEPTVTTEYVVKWNDTTDEGEAIEVVEAITPVKTIDGRDYFNKDSFVKEKEDGSLVDQTVYLRVTVTDTNARYKELQHSMSGLSAVDSNGNVLASAEDGFNSDAARTINGYNATTIVEGGFTWDIPLTTDGNYTIPIAYEDLLKRTASITGVVTTTTTEEGVDSNQVLVTVDRETPVADTILVTYSSDTDEKLSFAGIVKDLIDKIFGKETISVTLYVEDTISGVAEVAYTYVSSADDEKKLTGNGEISDTKVTLTSEDGVAEEYQGKSYYKVDLELKVDKKDTFMIGNLQLIITDTAGNALEEVTGNTVLIIDYETPKLAVERRDPNGTTEENGVVKNYYKPQKDASEDVSAQTGIAETFTLTFTETFYNENVRKVEGTEVEEVIPPDIRISVNGEEMDAETLKQCVSFGGWSDDTKEIAATISLPYSEVDGGEEIEYQIFATYTDRSGNELEALSNDDIALGGFDGNTYQSGIIVLDNKAPKLTSYIIDGTSDRDDQNGVAVYQHREAPEVEEKLDDVVLTFVIDDSEVYWNANKENLTFEIYQDEEVYISIKGDNDALAWVDDGSTHTATYRLSVCNEDPATYYVKVSYADSANNQLVYDNMKENAEAGTYKSTDFVLDHTAPILDVTYNEAYRLVNDSDTSSLNDKKNAVPENGYTAYYNDKIKVTFTITEDYAKYVTDEKGKFVGFENYAAEGGRDHVLNITKTVWNGEEYVNTDVGAELIPNIKWTQDGNVYTGELVIEDSTGNHAADGTYVISMGYRDTANNKLVLGDNASSNGTIDEDTSYQYTSTKLVLDTKAPVLTTSYVANGEVVSPSNTYSEEDGTVREYFKEDIELQITVEDDYVRYEELKEGLVGLKATDVSGTGRESNSAATDIANRDGSAVVTTGNFTWNIPLSTEANYTIPISYEDLAGNAAVWGDANICQKKVTVDKTTPEGATVEVVYGLDDIDKTDKNIFGSIVNAVTEFFNGLFAKEEINVTLYIYDDTAGVASIDYQYGEISVTEEEVDRIETIDNVSYAVIEFSLDNDENKYVSEELKITAITDKAGMVFEETIAGSKKLIIDRVSPVLDAEYGEPDGTVDNMRFYAAQTDETGKKEEIEKVWLKFKEAYHRETYTCKNERPDVKLYKVEKKEGEDTLIETEMANAVTWSDFDEATGMITATIELPYSTEDGGGEIEYQIRAYYQDGSGNQMVAGELNFGSISQGENGIACYESGIIVLDNKAPELLSYAITGTTNGTYIDGQNGIAVYAEQAEKQDVTLSFEIEDNTLYWNKDNVKVSIINESSDEVSEIGADDIAWSISMANSDIHKGTCSFTAPDSSAATYKVQIKYQDTAQNQLVMGDGKEGVCENGCYTSKPFIVDKVAPKFAITYNEAVRLVNSEDTSSEGDIVKGEDAYPTTNYTAYYNGDIEVCFTIVEDYVNLDDNNQMQDFECKVNEEAKEVIWKQEGNKFTGSITLTGDAVYEITAQYKDLAVNEMNAGGEVQGSKAEPSMSDGEYQSIPLIIDTIAPVINTAYNYDVKDQMIDKETGRKYFANKDVKFTIIVEDVNARYGELYNALCGMSAGYASGVENLPAINIGDSIDSLEEYKASQLFGKDGFTLSIPLQVEGNYTIPISFEDLAGNTAVFGEDKVEYEEYEELVTIDYTEPEIKLETYENKLSGWEKLTRVLIYGNREYFFAQETMQVKATATDNISGIREINFSFNGDEAREEEKHSFKPEATVSCSTREIPLTQSDYKGTVTAAATNYSLITTASTQGNVVEKAGSDNNNGWVSISEPSVSRIVDGEAFYNSNITLGVTYHDDYAGINNWNYIVSDGTGASGVFADEIQMEHSTSVPVNINANDILVSAGYTDNAGYTHAVSRTYNIDTTIPTITVTYDNNDPANEKYYNQARTATVAIQERNFSENDVQFTITNTDGSMPAISGWTTTGAGDETIHRCTVTFAEDGDYTFTVAFQDKAGNKAEYTRVDEFTIDRTEPTYTVTYDNADSKNGYYYAAGRTATIDILEHNFDPSLVNIAMTATKADAGVPTISGWSTSGDHHIATISFSADGDYTFDISGMDMSENPMADYAGDRFIVDTKAPSIEIFDVDNMAAYNGVIMPGIRYSDINYDAENSIIDMVGYNNGKVEMNGDITRSDTGVEIKLHDFEHIQSMDDIYTMKATVFDLAGNSSDASVVFSVNRFGSVYTYDEATEALIGANGKYYTNSEQDIVITETNVDTLEFKQITCNLNGKLITLEEGVHYILSESGSDLSWKQYTYTLLKENFVEEGLYLITIYSEDRASNTSDNSSKGMKIEFVVDKTSPSVLVSGIVNDEQYRENSKEVTLDIQDNVLLSEVKVILNGQETLYSASQVEELDGKITLTIGSANNWQTLRVIAYDAAGNDVTSEELNFLITTNIFIQFIMNRQLLIGSIAGVAVLGAAIFFLIAFKKRKKDEEA